MKSNLALILFWIGFLLAISFFEAPLKFTAHGITTEIGVSIGKVIFYYLNKVEIVLGILTLFITICCKQKNLLLPVCSLFILVAFQSIFALPILDKEATTFLATGIRSNSPWHAIYIALEVIKLIILIVTATLILKRFEIKIKK